MKKTSRSLLAAALMLALPMGGAMACTVGNWNGSNTATDADSGGPADGVARYSGVCALSVSGNKYVVDNSPNAEGTYRARFYVLTGNSSATIFKATASNDGAGASAIEVAFNGSAFSFSENGNAAGTVAAQANKWYSVEMYYKAGGEFSAWVWGAGSASEVGNVSKTSGVGSGTVGSAVMGVASGSGTFNFDAFESTRSETDRIARLCRGDANGDNSLSVVDRVALNNELLERSTTSGQPDCNEDGAISVFDRVCLSARILADDTCP